MSSFEENYPYIDAWVYNGQIQVGCGEYDNVFLRVIDAGGTVWESSDEYKSIDEAFAAVEAGIAAWCEEEKVDIF